MRMPQALMQIGSPCRGVGKGHEGCPEEGDVFRSVRVSGHQEFAI